MNSSLAAQTLGDPRAISPRPATPEDEGFLREVYASTRGAELALVAWTEAQRQTFLKMQFDAQQWDYRRRFPGLARQVIVRDGKPVGRLYVARVEEEIRILDLTVLPQHRNAGVGTAIIREILAEAAEAGKLVRIYVESFNPSLRLFERLGFGRAGEKGVHLLMEWRPAGGGEADRR